MSVFVSVCVCNCVCVCVFVCVPVFKGGVVFVCYFQCDFLSEGWTREVAQVSQRKQSRM